MSRKQKKYQPYDGSIPVDDEQEPADQEDEVGRAIIILLNLRPNRKGQYKTAWGDKTRKGLGASVMRTLEQDVGLYIE